MTKSRSRSPSRSSSRSVPALVLAALVASAVALFACAETRRTLGEDCLKSDDCLSGICSSLKCAEAPPILGASPTATADSGVDAAPDVAADSAPDVENDAGPDASSD